MECIWEVILKKGIVMVEETISQWSRKISRIQRPVFLELPEKATPNTFQSIKVFSDWLIPDDSSKKSDWTPNKLAVHSINKHLLSNNNVLYQVLLERCGRSGKLDTYK